MLRESSQALLSLPKNAMLCCGIIVAMPSSDAKQLPNRNTRKQRSVSGTVNLRPLNFGPRWPLVLTLLFPSQPCPLPFVEFVETAWVLSAPRWIRWMQRCWTAYDHLLKMVVPGSVRRLHHICVRLRPSEEELRLPREDSLPSWAQDYRLMVG